MNVIVNVMFSQSHISRIIFLLTLGIVIPAFTQDQSSDRFSGRTLRTEDMIYQMLKSRSENAPRPGESAPDFEIFSIDRKSKVSLNDLLSEKPVVLIFSSWGCDVFREALGGLSTIYHQYKDQANFVMIYTREIHPLDGFAAVLGRVKDPVSDSERRETANRCREQLKLPFEMLVDDISDPVTTRWAGMPVRLFFIEQNGKIGYAGAQGPWGFKPYDGFLHGTGKTLQKETVYDTISLESFLKKRFPDKETAK